VGDEGACEHQARKGKPIWQVPFVHGGRSKELAEPEEKGKKTADEKALDHTPRREL